MLRKNYLVDQFYGSDYLFSHYHLPGEGNLRGFVGSGERGAEALIASTTEACLQKNLAKENQDPINLEFVTFADAGIFFNRNKEDIYHRDVSNNQYESRFLANGGIGLRFGTKFYEKDLFLRIDFPFYIFDGSNSNMKSDNWVFSFQKSM